MIFFKTMFILLHKLFSSSSLKAFSQAISLCAVGTSAVFMSGTVATGE